MDLDVYVPINTHTHTFIDEADIGCERDLLGGDYRRSQKGGEDDVNKTLCMYVLKSQRINTNIIKMNALDS